MPALLRTAVLILIALLSGGRAAAEGTLIGSEPGNNAVIGAFNQSVRCWFSGNVSERSPSLIVLDERGARVDNNDAQLTIGDRTELSVSTQPLTPGIYVFRYRVVTKDGLVVSGISRFRIRNQT